MKEIARIPTPWSYSTAVAAGDFVFLGIHRGEGDSFGAQLESAVEEVKKTLAHFELALADIVKIQVWLKHVKDLPEMEKRFLSLFETDSYPARMTSTTEFIDEDCLLMLEGIAYRG